MPGGLPGGASLPDGHASARLAASPDGSGGGVVTATDRLAEIQARLDAATPRPWHLDARGDWGVYTEAMPSATSSDIASAVRREDEVLLAHAPDDLAVLLAAVKKVQEVHWVVEWKCEDPLCDDSPHSGSSCAECGETHPCRTYREIEEAVGTWEPLNDLT